MEAYSKVPRGEAKKCGAKIIATRWIDVNKGDRGNRDYRSRLVGREIKRDQRPDLFVATPPFESMRMIISICASHQNGGSPCRILTFDIKRAYCFANVKRPIYIYIYMCIEMFVEDGEENDEHLVGKLNLSLYGTRGAAQNWQNEFIDHLVSHGFNKGKSPQ